MLFYQTKETRIGNSNVKSKENKMNQFLIYIIEFQYCSFLKLQSVSCKREQKDFMRRLDYK